jgi:hypothetical protein
VHAFALSAKNFVILSGNNITGPRNSVDTTTTNRISSKAIVAGAVTGTVVVMGSMIAVLFCLIRKRQLPYQRLKNERKEGNNLCVPNIV